MFFVRDGKWIVGYRTIRPVKEGEQLIVSYGTSYWHGRPLFNPVYPDSEPVRVVSSSDDDEEDEEEAVEENPVFASKP